MDSRLEEMRLNDVYSYSESKKFFVSAGLCLVSMEIIKLFLFDE